MFTISEINDIAYATRSWTCIVGKFASDLRHINDLSDKQISNMSFYDISNAVIDMILLNMILMEKDLDKHKINLFLKSLCLKSKGFECYKRIKKGNSICTLDIFKMILTKYINNDNAIKTLCPRHYNNNIQIIYFYASISAKQFHISDIPLYTIYKTTVPDCIVGKLRYDIVMNDRYGMKFIKNNPDRIIKANRNEIIQCCIGRKIVIDIFVGNPELLKYCIYYKPSFTLSELNTIINIYNDNTMKMSSDILLTLIGKCVSKKVHCTTNAIGTITECIE
jgi:hypothetical protein